MVFYQELFFFFFFGVFPNCHPYNFPPFHPLTKLRLLVFFTHIQIIILPFHSLSLFCSHPFLCSPTDISLALFRYLLSPQVDELRPITATSLSHYILYLLCNMTFFYFSRIFTIATTNGF